MHIGLAKI